MFKIATIKILIQNDNNKNNQSKNLPDNFAMLAAVISLSFCLTIASMAIQSDNLFS